MDHTNIWEGRGWNGVMGYTYLKGLQTKLFTVLVGFLVLGGTVSLGRMGQEF